MNKKYKHLFLNTIVFSIGTIGSKLILFFLVPFYTNVLSVTDYGISELVFSISQLLIPLFSLAIYDALLRFGLSKAYDKKEVFQITNFVLVTGSLLLICLTPLFGFYKAIADWKWYVCIYGIVSFFSTNNLTYLKVYEKNKSYSILCIVQALLLALFNILFLLILKMGISGYLLSSICSTGIIAFVSFFGWGLYKDLKIKNLNKPLLKKIIVYSIPLMVNSLSWWIIHSSDKIMIQLMVDDSSLGLYTAASKIPSLINVVITIFIQAWGISSIADIDSEHDKEFYKNVFNGFYTILFVFASLLILLIKFFMRIYVGKSFFESWIFVPLLILAACFNGISSFCGSIYNALYKAKNMMYTTIITALLNIILNYTFILFFSTWGAIIGTVVSYFVISIVRLVDVRRFESFDVNIIKYVMFVIVLSIQSILVSLECYIYVVSILSFVILLLLSIKDVLRLFKQLFLRNRGINND